MCRQFKGIKFNEDFRKWIEDNPTGYVFNHFGGQNRLYNVLHQQPMLGECLRDQMTARIEKVCCSDQECIESTVSQLRRGSWVKCGNGCVRGKCE